MPRGSLLLTNHSSYASQLTIPRGKLEALDDFAFSLETKGRSSRGRKPPLLQFRLAGRSSTLYHFFLSPKIAVPTLTKVAPSSMAISKSFDIPMESSLNGMPSFIIFFFNSLSRI